MVVVMVLLVLRVLGIERGGGGGPGSLLEAMGFVAGVAVGVEGGESRAQGLGGHGVRGGCACHRWCLGLLAKKQEHVYVCVGVVVLISEDINVCFGR